MLIGTWMFSGTIPMLVYYGVQLVNPQFMIITAFLVTGTMSLTGSDTLANYEAALRSVTYQSTSDDPSNQTRTVYQRCSSASSSSASSGSIG